MARRRFHEETAFEPLLRQRVRDLALLELDVACQPLCGDGPDTPHLVIAVDWSEVMAYILADAPRADEPITHVMPAETVAVAHQVALLVLFERLVDAHVTLLLLPPYMAEMQYYLDLTESALLTPDADDELATRLATHCGDGAAFDRLLHIAKAVANVPLPERYAAFVSLLQQQIARADLVARIEDVFGDSLRYTLLMSRHAKTALLSMFEVSNGRGARLKALGDLPAEVTRGLDLAPAREDSWDALLRDAGHNKPVVARRRDAQALVLLEQLNVACHANNMQLLFVTRDHALRRVIDSFPGRFACLSDIYARRPAKALLGYPTLVRSWSSFMELGLVTKEQRFDDVQSQIGERRAAAEASLESIHGRPAYVHIAQANIARREFHKEVQNTQAMLSTERPWLPATPPDTRQYAIHNFVKYVTDPDAYHDERQRLREGLLTVIHNLRGESMLAQASGFDDGHAPETWRPLAWSVLVKLDAHEFCKDWESDLSSRFTKVVMYLQRRAESTRASRVRPTLVIADIIRDATTATIQDTPEAARRAIVHLSAIYALGSTLETSLAYFLVRFEPALAQCKPHTPEWLLLQLFRADEHLWRGSSFAASQTLEFAWEELSAETPMPLLLRVAFLNACLLMELDWAEQAGEDLMRFAPAHRHRDQYQLEVARSRLASAVAGQWAALAPHVRLAMSVRNNLVYASARLAPLYRRWATPEWLQTRAEDKRIRKRTLQHALLDRATDEMAKQLLKGPRPRPIEHLDTLIYYELKRAEWFGVAGTGRSHLARAEVLLRSAEARKTGSKRVRAALQSHRELLSKLKEDRKQQRDSR